MNYILWNKKDKINGIDAQYFIDDLKIQENDGVFLIGNRLDNIQAIEIDRIIKSVYGLDDNLTTEEVAQEYVKIKEEEKLQVAERHPAQMANADIYTSEIVQELKAIKELVAEFVASKQV